MENRKIKFRFWDMKLKAMCYRLPLLNDFNHPEIMPLQFTGFYDKVGKEIYEGDILSDYTQTDEGVLQSKLQVFFDHKKGAWRLDNSFSQDKSHSTALHSELQDYNYKVSGHVYGPTITEIQNLLLAGKITVNKARIMLGYTNLNCGDCNCSVKFPDIGCDTLKDCKLQC